MRNIPPLDEALVLALHRSGLSALDISIRLGCSDYRIRTLLRRRGEAIRRRGHSPATRRARSSGTAVSRDASPRPPE